MAWPASPSASPIKLAAFADSIGPEESFSVRNVVTVFKKHLTDKPPVNLADVDVGSVWFNPAA